MVMAWLKGGFPIVRLQAELHLPVDRVSQRRLGNGVLLAPVKAATWPPGYFENIRITGESFKRPDRETPPIERLAED